MDFSKTPTHEIVENANKELSIVSKADNVFYIIPFNDKL